jgi:hypothetical protein
MIIRSTTSLVKIRISRRPAAALGRQNRARAAAREAETMTWAGSDAGMAQPSPIVKVEGPLHGL